MWGGNCSSKFYKRLGIYKNSSGSYTFNPETCEAYSYRHWPLLKRFGGWLVVNNRRYSVTTTRHVSVLRGDMRERKLVADLIVDTGSMTAETVLLALVRDAHKDAKAFAKDNKLSYSQAVKEVKRERKEQAESEARTKARRKAESLERRSLDKTWKAQDTIVSVECFSG